MRNAARDLAQSLSVYADVLIAHRARNYNLVVNLLSQTPPEIFRANPVIAAAYATAINRTSTAPETEKIARKLIRQQKPNGVSRSLVELTNLYGVSLFEQGKLGQAQRALSDAHSMATNIGAVTIAAWAEMNLGVISDIKCKWTEALAHYERAKSVFRSSEDSKGLALVYNNQSITYRQLGFLTTAYDAAERARMHGARAVTEGDLIMFNCSRCEILAELDQFPFARKIAEPTLERSIALGLRRQQAECLRVIGKIELLAKNFIVAESKLEGACEVARRVEADLILAESLQLLAMLYTESNRREIALSTFRQAKKVFQKCGAGVRARAA